MSAFKSFRFRALSPAKRKESERKETRARLGAGIFFALALVTNVGFLIWSTKHTEKKALADAPFTSLAEGNLHERAPSLQSTVFGPVPNRIFINGRAWHINQVDHFKDAEGHEDGIGFGGVQAETACEYQQIIFIPVENQTEIRENIMHEVFHAAACSHGGDSWWNSKNDTEDHPGVYHLGEFMAEFAAANPGFMTWMARAESR
jgi:hypothetical protein